MIPSAYPSDLYPGQVYPAYSVIDITPDDLSESSATGSDLSEAAVNPFDLTEFPV